MVASIGAVAAPGQGVSYYERDGCYAKDNPGHRAVGARAGRGAEALGLAGEVDRQQYWALATESNTHCNVREDSCRAGPERLRRSGKP